MTPEEIAELRALEKAATPGPWRNDFNECGGIYEELGRLPFKARGVYLKLHARDAALIVAARNALPWLLDALEAATKPIAEMRVAGVIKLVRESFWNDSAEGESVHLLADACELFARERDAANARADAAEARDKGWDQGGYTMALEQRLDAAEASAAAMRSALTKFFTMVKVSQDEDVCRNLVLFYGETVEDALRSEAGAALLADRDRLRKLCAEAAVIIRIALAFPPESRDAALKALAERLEEASK